MHKLKCISLSASAAGGCRRTLLKMGTDEGRMELGSVGGLLCNQCGLSANATGWIWLSVMKHTKNYFFMRCAKEDLVSIISDLFNENNVLWKNSINIATRGWTLNCSILRIWG